MVRDSSGSGSPPVVELTPCSKKALIQGVVI